MFNIMFCISGLSFGLAFMIFLWNMSLLLRYETADGQIVREENSGSSEDTGAHAIVQFTTRNGQAIEFRDSAYFGFFLDILWGIYSKILGQDPAKVKVIYNPNNPERARIKNFMRLHYGMLIPSIVGIVALGAGLAPNNLINKILDFLGNLPF